MKILVCGDWHGYTAAAKACAKKADQEGCDVIVQVGDFGFWPHTDPEYVETVSRHLAKRDKWMVWIDGNHENFDVLYNTEWERTEEGFWRIAPNVYYAPRGLRWRWDGVNFLALGGGYSIDKDWRLAQGPIGQYWWPQETITQRQVYEAIEGGAADVMFTHDCPLGVEIGNPDYKTDRESEQNRMAVRAVVDEVKPLRLYHGHFHHRQDSVLTLEGGARVEIVSLADWRGLPLDSTWTVLNTVEIKVQGDKEIA